MIKPTVGRVVEYRHAMMGRDEQPWAAIVVYVHNDREVNLAVFDDLGFGKPKQHVILVQEGDEIPNHDGYCTWMPYQKGQAAKTEAVERKLAAQVVGENELRGPEETLAVT